MKGDYSSFTSKLQNYYIEFLSRSPKYQTWLKEHNEVIQELDGTPFKLVPAKIIPRKKSEPLKPQELKKPPIFSSGSSKGQCVWDITDKFRCDSNRVILEIDIEKPIEILMEQVKEINKTAQEKYWEEMKDENWFGEYRFLADFKRDQKGQRKGRKDTYPFDEWDRYLKVYDLKLNGKSYREIAQKIFNDKNENATDKAKKAFKKAKILITAAEDNKFPPFKK